MRPFDTSSQSLQVPVCQNSSDSIPLMIAMLSIDTCMSPSAPAATAGRRMSLFAASSVNTCGFCTVRRSLHPATAASTARVPAHRTTRFFM